MSYHFDRKIYFDAVRSSLFGGRLTQQQVDGQNFTLDVWEICHYKWDYRWLAYALATTLHETASTMWPIEEYGKGSGQPYGKPDPETGQAYYGRGFVQLTWRDNYEKMTPVVADAFPTDDTIDLAWMPEQALIPDYAAEIMFFGMNEGMFRSDSKGPQRFLRYFSETVNDAYGAREIINGDKHIVPSWSNGMSIGNLIKGYHDKFIKALNSSYVIIEPEPEPEPEPVEPTKDVFITIDAPLGVKIYVNGMEVM